MFENKDLMDISQQLKAMNGLLRDVLWLLRDISDRMPYCSCKDEHAVGETWTCVFHGTVTKAQ